MQICSIEILPFQFVDLWQGSLLHLGFRRLWGRQRHVERFQGTKTRSLEGRPVPHTPQTVQRALTYRSRENSQRTRQVRKGSSKATTTWPPVASPLQGPSSHPSQQRARVTTWVLSLQMVSLSLEVIQSHVSYILHDCTHHAPSERLE